jgi:transposase
MRETRYPSDVSREAFEEIRALLESARKRTKPRRVDLYEVWCGVLYLLKSGCQWRVLPKDFPKWRTVHSYFAQWSEVGEDGVSLLERALKKSGG